MSRVARAMAGNDAPINPLAPPHTDWLRHDLIVTGPAPAVAALRRAAAGAGVIPWVYSDLDHFGARTGHFVKTAAQAIARQEIVDVSQAEANGDLSAVCRTRNLYAGEITTPGTYTVTPDAAQTIHSLVIDSPDATVLLDANMTMTGDIILDAGTIEFNGDTCRSTT